MARIDSRWMSIIAGIDIRWRKLSIIAGIDSRWRNMIAWIGLNPDPNVYFIESDTTIGGQPIWGDISDTIILGHADDCHKDRKADLDERRKRTKYRCTRSGTGTEMYDSWLMDD